jgi:hypothetical protein
MMHLRRGLVGGEAQVDSLRLVCSTCCARPLAAIDRVIPAVREAWNGESPLSTMVPEAPANHLFREGPSTRSAPFAGVHPITCAAQVTA